FSRFSYTSSSHHRDLHSFPTRRSSDLGATIIQRHRFRHDADTTRALHEDVVIGEQRVVLRDTRFEVVEEFARLCSPTCGQVVVRSEEHTSELQSRFDLVCRLLLEKKNK